MYLIETKFADGHKLHNGPFPNTDTAEAFARTLPHYGSAQVVEMVLIDTDLPVFYKDMPHWALCRIDDPRQYVAGKLAGIHHLLLHKSRQSVMDWVVQTNMLEWVEAVEVVPSQIGIFRHFILDGHEYAL